MLHEDDNAANSPKQTLAISIVVEMQLPDWLPGSRISNTGNVRSSKDYFTRNTTRAMIKSIMATLAFNIPSACSISCTT